MSDETMALLKHLRDSGALLEAEQMMDQLDAGTLSSPILSPDEVRARLSKYCGR